MFDSVFFKAILLVCGFLSCYKHENKFSLFAFLIQLINTLIGSDKSTFLDSFFHIEINTCLLSTVVILSCFTGYANKQYQYLENQFGFPYFNERFEEQNLDRRQTEIKSEFQQNYERYKKNSSDNMEDINLDYHSDDMGKNDSVRICTMDDIMEDYNEQSNSCT